MKSKKAKKLSLLAISIVLIFMLNLLNIYNSVNAASLNSASLYSAGECQYLLKYNGIPVKVTYVKYNNGNNSYPAYCLNKELPGVTDDMSYDVSANDAISDVGLWRVIINGYPYKSVSELGCQTEQEAFTATKQAVYCYNHGNDVNAYEPIGEAGQRTINALNDILNNAKMSSEVPLDNKITLNCNTNKWMQDDIDNLYLSKIYSVSNLKGIKSYSINLSDIEENLIDEIKVVNLKNEETKEFNINEEFKILIPIEKLIKEGSFKINVSALVKTKPVLYGISPDSSYQDYAITCATYEDGIGKLVDNYNKNETKIIIIKQDEETQKRLEGVEFELFDQDKKSICTVKTNSNGEAVIDNIIPGKYYLKEIKTQDGYNIVKEEVEINIELNEKKEVKVDNSKIKVTTELPVAKEEIKKLPVTGM